MVFESLGSNLLALIKEYNYRGIPIPIVRHITRHVRTIFFCLIVCLFSVSMVVVCCSLFYIRFFGCCVLNMYVFVFVCLSVGCGSA